MDQTSRAVVCVGHAVRAQFAPQRLRIGRVARVCVGEDGREGAAFTVHAQHVAHQRIHGHGADVLGAGTCAGEHLVDDLHDGPE